LVDCRRWKGIEKRVRFVADEYSNFVAVDESS